MSLPSPEVGTEILLVFFVHSLRALLIEYDVRCRWPNRPVSQVRVPLAACRELAVDYDTFIKLLYVFGH